MSHIRLFLIAKNWKPVQASKDINLFLVIHQDLLSSLLRASRSHNGLWLFLTCKNLLEARCKQLVTITKAAPWKPTLGISYLCSTTPWGFDFLYCPTILKLESVVTKLSYHEIESCFFSESSEYDTALQRIEIPGTVDERNLEMGKKKDNCWFIADWVYTNLFQRVKHQIQVSLLKFAVKDANLTCKTAAAFKAQAF